MADLKSQKRYLIAKVNNFPSLRQAVQTGQWACADKTVSPQPRDILTEAFSQGQVVIIFSVSNCHGWHGYAEMLNVPGNSKKVCNAVENVQRSEVNTDLEVTSKIDSVSVSQNNAITESKVRNTYNDPGVETTDYIRESKESGLRKAPEFHYFDISWKLNYLEFGEQCLNSKSTEDLLCVEKPGANKIRVNKCRNWQEVDTEVGESLCEKMQEFYDCLCKRRDERAQRETDARVDPFYKETRILTVEETWRKIVCQVEQELGKVILACPFGSQRYNLHTADSDTDMFIVYQAKTRDILSFHPPKQTIKNQEGESCDYTIHEVYRYCELLLSGDARCVETLFIHESTVIQASPEWHTLKRGRTMFLNRNIVDGEDLKVFRETGSAERDVLMTIRAGNVSVQHAWNIINELENSITAKSEQVVKRGKDVEEFLENWLLTQRYDSFHKPASANWLNRT